jgi:hypothetical protein
MNMHPIQEIITDANGSPRFRENLLVRHLLDWASARGCDLNDLARLRGPTADDWRQFAQLIGYSLSGYGELSYVTDDAYGAAARMADGERPEGTARANHLQQELDELRSALREPIARLYGKHPDDLQEIQ